MVYDGDACIAKKMARSTTHHSLYKILTLLLSCKPVESQQPVGRGHLVVGILAYTLKYTNYVT